MYRCRTTFPSFPMGVGVQVDSRLMTGLFLIVATATTTATRRAARARTRATMSSTPV
ncbi:uncharacterized protein COLE_03563 [Cutaneotrichosporon oleaginosum]|uniref:uncharacterized protein n=1 Tax=Cutaneotrichosporon oleaginosum TaxID=879819 RepID=UPI00132AAD37|nr:hypothetical protein COLE_03563 [Cutaneotrichosporon oleaginosum]